MHRVRVGLTGLAFVFLLVMLATTFLRASEERGSPGGAAVVANDTAPSEPLAQLGVAPGNAPSEQNTTSSAAPARTAR